MPTIELTNGVIEGSGGRILSIVGEGASLGGLRWVRANYTFATEGGLVSTIGLLGGTRLPAGAVILGGFLDIITPPVGSGASIAIQVEAANDIVTAAAISGAPWSTTGRKSVIPVFTGAASVKTTAARDVSAVISAAALTAGVFDVYLCFIATA